jgi:uncharacterized protein YciU (UPF0263 family)
MTRITILEQKLVQLQEKRDAAGLVCRELEDARIDQLSAMFNEIFTSALEPTDVLVVLSDRVQFTRPELGCNYNKQVLDLYFKNKDWSSQTATQIQTSFYSTTDNSEFELRRMILIGKVGQIVLDQSQDILHQFNTIKSDTQAKISKARTAEWDLQREITSIKSQIQDIEQANLLNQLETEGIEFTEDDPYRLPTLDITATRCIRRVKSIRITDRTASGKSADIKVKTIEQAWDMFTESYVEREVEHVFHKVRMSNIDSLIMNNSTKILTTS